MVQMPKAIKMHTVRFIAARNTINDLVSEMDSERVKNIFALLREMTEEHASVIAQLQIAKKTIHNLKYAANEML
jgi:hypothetical protein